MLLLLQYSLSCFASGRDSVQQAFSFENPIQTPISCVFHTFMLLKRQLGYAMMSPPKDREFVPFIINTINPLNLAVKRVKRAWTSIF